MAQEQNARQNETTKEPSRARRRGHAHRIGRRTIISLFMFPLVFAVIAGVALVGREITAPSWITRQVEAHATGLLAGGQATFGQMTVMLGTDLHPRVTLDRVVLRDAAGAPLARLPKVEALISPRGVILRRDILVQEIRLTGAQINLRRAKDGSVAVAFETSGESFRQAASFSALLEEIDRTLEQPYFEAFEQITADGLIVNFDDARAGRSWTVDGGQITLDLRGQKTALHGDLSVLSGRSYVTSITLDYNSPRGSRTADIALNMTDVFAADLGTQSPALSWLSVLDAPLSAAMRASIEEDGQLGPLNATLEIGAGVIQPTEDVRPIPFDAAKTYLTYDPARAEVVFNRISAESAWGRFDGEGQAILQGIETGWPDALIGQFTLSNIEVNPDDMFDTPRRFDEVGTDFRLLLDPFHIDLGQFFVTSEGQTIHGEGSVDAGPQGWQVGIDARAQTLEVPWLLSLWPPGLRTKSRTWFFENFLGGSLTDFEGALRLDAGLAFQTAGNFAFSNTTLRFLKTFPPLEDATGFATWSGKTFTAIVDEGTVLASQGGRLDLAGSVFQVPDFTQREAPGNFTLQIEGTVTAALAMLDLPPFGFISKSGLPVTIADGFGKMTGYLTLPLKENVQPGETSFNIDAQVLDVHSDTLVEGYSLAAARLAVHADNQRLEISGPLRLGEVAADAVWARALGPDTGAASRITAEAILSPAFLDEFNIGLPEGSVSGRGRADVVVDLLRDEAPTFTLTSDLRGLGLALPAIGWAKSAAQEGVLEVEGTLGAVPAVTRLVVSANGLEAEGAVTLNEGGGLDVATFDAARVGGWFDGQLRLIGRGAGRPLAIEIPGGRMDLRAATFGDSGGQGGPIKLALDSLQISEGIALDDLRGEFTDEGGLSGQFTAQLNATAAIQGTVIPRNGSTAVRVTGHDAGSVFRAAGLLENASGGDFEMTLIPTGIEGNYDGELAATDLRVKDAPALAGLLDAISVVGLLQQLDGQGLMFANVDAKFRLTPEQIIVTQSSAVGPGLGISMDGTYTLADKRMDFQGVISPFYFLNAVGAVLTRPGEGLLGFNYTLRGQGGESRVGVNPLSALTPGMFRDLFRRPPPTVSE